MDVQISSAEHNSNDSWCAKVACYVNDGHISLQKVAKSVPQPEITHLQDRALNLTTQ